MNEEDIELNLTLKVNEINLVLNSLAKPIESVNNLIQKIREQGEYQLSQIQSANQPTNQPTEVYDSEAKQPDSKQPELKQPVDEIVD